MIFADFLRQEWRPGLGCTEPASIALAAATAAHAAGGTVTAVRLVCDARMYKNCYAVGVPHSGHRSGLRWALAIGSQLPDPSAGLEIFRQTDAAALARAGALLEAGAVTVDVDPTRSSLHVDCTVVTSAGVGRAVIAGDHTRMVRLERDGVVLPLAAEQATVASVSSLREELAAMELDQLAALARSLTSEDRAALRRGAETNVAIARHGLTLLPERFTQQVAEDGLSRISRLVCAGVYARMCGEDMVVMTLAGSGNKGITCAVPITLWGRGRGLEEARVDEALALACLVTSATTWHLGTLSAVCGCSNAAGIGLAAGVVILEGGGVDDVSLAISNMVGNVTGMICDGAKVGCALKTMTAVDAAFRAATLALSGVGIPGTDGVVGADGRASLANLGRIATFGMPSLDTEILAIMREKLDRCASA
jgi:L-cysteine desulfidase